MIERVSTPSGEDVIRFRGRLLASRFDPRREAAAWLEARRPFLRSVKSVFVLGLGSGHHVEELARATPARLIVLETQEPIARLGAELRAFDPKRVAVVEVGSARALRADENVQKAVRESFVVLSHAPSLAVDPELYEECRAQLLGRDWGSLNWQWKMRNGPSFDRVARHEPNAAPLTIYDLEQTELVQDSEERERLLFKALRELVK